MAESPAQVTPTGIEPRPRLGGYTLADIVIAGTAILISCISLFIATKQSGIMERTLAASSWPLLQIRSSNADTSGHEIINFSVQNVGVGPAIVKSFYAEYAGRRASHPGRIPELCCGHIPVTRGKFEPGDPQTNFIAKTVIRAGGEIDILHLPRAPKNEAVWQKLDAERFKM